MWQLYLIDPAELTNNVDSVVIILTLPNHNNKWYLNSYSDYV